MALRPFLTQPQPSVDGVDLSSLKLVISAVTSIKRDVASAMEVSLAAKEPLLPSQVEGDIRLMLFSGVFVY